VKVSDRTSVRIALLASEQASQSLRRGRGVALKGGIETRGNVRNFAVRPRGSRASNFYLKKDREGNKI